MLDITVYDKNWNILCILDSFKSFIWTDRFNEYGDVELQMAVDSQLLEYLTLFNYIRIPDSEHVMIINKITVSSTVDEGSMAKITGFSAEWILGRRIVWNPVTYSGNVQHIIHQIVATNVGPAAESKRNVPGFNMVTHNSGAFTNPTDEKQLDGDNVYTVVKDLCSKHDIGFRVLRKNDQWEMDLYEGTDRSYRQTINPYIVFSPTYDNLLESEYIYDAEDYANTALVIGENNNDNKTKKRLLVSPEGSLEALGLERFEIKTDAQNRNSSNDNEKLTDAQYESVLRSEGTIDLASHKLAPTYTGKADYASMYHINEDYVLGDIVQLQNEFGLSAVSRISEVTYSWDENGYTVVPTFSELKS